MMPGIASADAGVLQSSSGGGGGGGGSVLDTQTVVCGASGNKLSGTTKVGFVLSGLGSISDGTSNLYSGALIRGLFAAYNSGTGDFDVTFQVTGVVANSGWTTLTLNSGFTLYRADAIFSASTNSQWTWPSAGNLMGGAGDVVSAVFA